MDSYPGFRQRPGDFLRMGDIPERCAVTRSGPECRSVEEVVVARSEHDHSIERAALYFSVRAPGRLARVVVAGVGADQRHRAVALPKSGCLRERRRLSA